MNFIALKMLTGHFFEIGPLTSLSIIVTMLGITIGLSLIVKRPPPKPST